MPGPRAGGGRGGPCSQCSEAGSPGLCGFLVGPDPRSLLWKPKPQGATDWQGPLGGSGCC